MNESSQACCEHYQSGGWMNTLSCKAQLLFSCLTACLSSCLSTCLPDYLPTYRAPFVQIKGAWTEGVEVKYYFFSQEFIFKRRSVEFLYSVCLKTSLPASPANCPASFYYSLWQAAFLLTCLLKYPCYLCESVHSSKPPNPWICASFYWISSSLHLSSLPVTQNASAPLKK